MTDDLLEAVTQLGDTLAAENTALRALDLAAAARLLPVKQDAAARLTAAAAARAGVRPSPAMRPAAARLRDLADENRRLLERAVAVQTRVLGVLAGAARTADPAPRYGRTGGYAARPAAGWALSARA